MDPRPVRWRRLVLGVSLAALLLTGCAPADDEFGTPSAVGSWPAPPTAPATVDPRPTPSATFDPMAACPAAGIRIRSLGSDAAMGLRAIAVELLNCGTEPYRLMGHPDLRVLDERRQLLPVGVVLGATGITGGFDAAPRQLTLRPGQRAVATVLWRNKVTDPTVVATNGAYLEVAPVPGQPATMVETYGPVDLGNTGRIGVSAWRSADGPPSTVSPAPVPTDPTERPQPTRSTPLP